LKSVKYVISAIFAAILFKIFVWKPPIFIPELGGTTRVDANRYHFCYVSTSRSRDIEKVLWAFWKFWWKFSAENHVFFEILKFQTLISRKLFNFSLIFFRNLVKNHEFQLTFKGFWPNSCRTQTFSVQSMRFWRNFAFFWYFRALVRLADNKFCQFLIRT